MSTPHPDITFTIAHTPLGSLLVAATRAGICEVSAGDDATALARSFLKAHPTARRDDDALQDRVAALVAGLTRPPAGSIAIDMHGTAFQQKVWNALLAIPRGQTRSYSDIAAAIGKPAAVRAVAQACGQNRIGILIPCHRVVQKNGRLGGYAGGVARKKQLLAWEGAPVGRS